MEKIEQWNGHSIRFVEHNGEWWAVLADIAKALDLKPKYVKERLGDEVVLTDHVLDSLGRKQEMLIVVANPRLKLSKYGYLKSSNSYANKRV